MKQSSQKLQAKQFQEKFRWVKHSRSASNYKVKLYLGPSSMAFDIMQDNYAASEVALLK